VKTDEPQPPVVRMIIPEIGIANPMCRAANSCGVGLAGLEAQNDSAAGDDVVLGG
jgi:hypothetical protein